MLLNDLILREQLFPHLWEIDETAHIRVEKMMTELLKRNPMPNKATHQREWVGKILTFGFAAKSKL